MLFDTLEKAIDHYNMMFKMTGILLGIEKVAIDD